MRERELRRWGGFGGKEKSDVGERLKGRERVEGNVEEMEGLEEKRERKMGIGGSRSS